MLRESVNEEMFDILADVFTREWREQGEDRYADAVENFTHGCHKHFYLGASKIASVLSITQSAERNHREMHRNTDPKADHTEVISHKHPNLLFGFNASLCDNVAKLSILLPP